MTKAAELAKMGEVLTNSQIGGRRNIIINGAMNLDQRNSGSEVVPASDAYTLDRFRYNASQASKLKVQQNAQADTPPEGFSNYLGVTVNATHTVASTDNFFLTYFVEGFDIALKKAQHLDIINIGNDREIKILELVKMILKVMKIDCNIKSGEFRKGSTLRRCPDISKLRQLGFKPNILLEHSLSEIIKWYSNNKK